MRIDEKRLKETIDFHGHSCPGLAIGIRAAELAMDRLGITETTNAVCVTETDMCGVDAIQYLTPCTFGKGNLIHRDFGKSAFTFFNRDTGTGFRAVFTHKFAEHREDRALFTQKLMGADLSELFDTTDIDRPPVRPAKILTSIPCRSCGEKTMESRIRLFDGGSYCIPCFERVEQKI